MHHKYVIRDGATVWTGSLNWTDDSWSRQENVVAIVHSEAIAKAYRIDFDQLWTTGDVDADRLRRPALGRRRARVVHARPRRGPLGAHREDDPPREAARPHLLAGDHDRPGARHARAGDRRQVASTSPAASTRRRSAR